MIEQSLKDRIAKLRDMANLNCTDGEKYAAKALLDKILAKHNLDESILESIDLVQYHFKYATELDCDLLGLILENFTNGGRKRASQSKWKRTINSMLTYSDYVTTECMYEYFRRHMKGQWKILCLAELKKCRKSKTRNARRKELQALFFSQYVIKSGLCKPDQITTAENISSKEMQDREKLSGLQGGKYNRQVTTHLLLEN